MLCLLEQVVLNRYPRWVLLIFGKRGTARNIARNEVL